MPPYTATQKAAIQQFTGFTSAKDSVAVKHLKAQNWNIEQAVDSFFASPNNPTPTGPTSSAHLLNKLFDKYRDPLIHNPPDNAKNEPDSIGVEGSMRYLADLGLSLDEPVVLAILTELNAPTMGELTREGFCDGWRQLRALNITDQKATLPNLRTSLASPTQGLFRKTYRHTFRMALSPGQRSLPLDTATEYFRLLLSPPSLKWSTPTTPWLDLWLEYLTTKWKKAVSKDVWEQTGVFVQKSLEDESMGWWSEDGAWPSCLDEFVAFVSERKGVDGDGDGGDEEADSMEL
ncbi:MAG: hypothetical protein L6R41_004014 [Letrouitia leprolyta]|nr:MAG: hypothetical protein L6R41_004014 [Letrouitia leprolyta]